MVSLLKKTLPADINNTKKIKSENKNISSSMNFDNLFRKLLANNFESTKFNKKESNKTIINKKESSKSEDNEIKGLNFSTSTLISNLIKNLSKSGILEKRSEKTIPMIVNDIIKNINNEDINNESIHNKNINDIGIKNFVDKLINEIKENLGVDINQDQVVEIIKKSIVAEKDFNTNKNQGNNANVNGTKDNGNNVINQGDKNFNIFVNDIDNDSSVSKKIMQDKANKSNVELQKVVDNNDKNTKNNINNRNQIIFQKQDKNLNSNNFSGSGGRKNETGENLNSKLNSKNFILNDKISKETNNNGTLNRNISIKDTNKILDFNSKNISQVTLNGINKTVSDNNVNTYGEKTPIKSNDIINQIVKTINYSKNNLLSTVKIQLKPDFLGKVEIFIRQQDGNLSASIITDNEKVKHQIEANINLLNNQLESKGLKINSFDVAVDKNMQFTLQYSGQWNTEGQNQQQNNDKMNYFLSIDYERTDKAIDNTFKNEKIEDNHVDLIV